MGISKEAARVIKLMASLLNVRLDLEEKLGDLVCLTESKSTSALTLSLRDTSTEFDGDNVFDGNYLYESADRNLLPVVKTIFNDALSSVDKDLLRLSTELNELLNNK